MCGNVIQGRFDPQLPFFTERGSFWSNGTTKLLASTSEKERQASTRNFCNKAGYESVALIPIKAAGETVGLFQLNDFSTGKFTLDMITQAASMTEKFADHILQIILIYTLD